MNLPAFPNFRPLAANSVRWLIAFRVGRGIMLASRHARRLAPSPFGVSLVSKWIRSLALAATVAIGTAGLVTVSGTAAQGQGKDTKTKQPETKPKPPEPKPAEAKGSVVITKDKQGKFRFQVRDGDDKVVMQCVKGYDTEKDATDAFNAALAIAKVAKPVLEKAGK